MTSFSTFDPFLSRTATGVDGGDFARSHGAAVKGDSLFTALPSRLRSTTAESVYFCQYPAIGVMKPDDCAAIHVNMPLVFPEPDQLQDMDAFEQAAVASLAHWEEKGSGYFKQQSTRPQTLGYGLADSPVGSLYSPRL